MKTTRLLKYTASVLILSVITSLTACGNKGGDSAPPVVQQQNVCGVNVNCQAPVGGNAFFQSESQDWYGMIKLNLTFMAQNPIANPVQQPNQFGSQYGGGYNYGGGFSSGYGSGGIYGGGSFGGGASLGSPIITYSGPVAASGTMTILQSMSLGMCQLPGGTYSLGTVTSGQWMSAMVYGLRMQASGPASVVMSISQGQVSAKTGSQLGQTWSEINPVGRIFGNVVIESVNGYPCNISVLVQ